MNDSKYTVNGSTMTGIADAVREMRTETGMLTPAQIEAKIRASRLGVPVTESGGHWNEETDSWERPTEWPDLDTVAKPAVGDWVYLTYDLTVCDTPFIGLQCGVTSGTWAVERGHIIDGIFVADETHDNLASGDIFRQPLDDGDGNVQLWRIITSAEFNSVYFVPSDATAALAFASYQQPCVERVGKISELKYFPGNPGASQHWGTRHLERCKMIISAYSGARATLYNLYGTCINLQTVDMTAWDLTGFTTPSFEGIFSMCFMLREIKGLSALDNITTTAVTAYHMFWQCFLLKYVKMPVAKINTLSNCFNTCSNLVRADLSAVDSSECTTMAGLFVNCVSLRDVDLTGISTASVTDMSSMFNGCVCLQHVDVSGFDTSNVNTMASMFYNCQSLQSIDVSRFSLEKVTTIASMFYGCYSLRELDMSGITTGAGILTTCAGMFTNCFAMTKIKLPIDIGMSSSITGGSAYGMVNNTYSLTEATGTKVYVSHSYNQALNLTHDSLVSILDRLPTVATTQTITLSQYNILKLTAEEIAVATAKGWTVA